jgi:hypothetical protein
MKFATDQKEQALCLVYHGVNQTLHHQGSTSTAAIKTFSLKALFTHSDTATEEPRQVRFHQLKIPHINQEKIITVSAKTRCQFQKHFALLTYIHSKKASAAWEHACSRL